MDKKQWQKIFNENKLNEASSAWRPLVGKVSQACDWEYTEIQEFIKALLIDSNYHDESKKVDKFMDKI